MHWSGEVADHHYVDETTEQVKESTLNPLTATSRCPECGCTFSGPTYALQLHQVEAHQILLICNCGYFSNLRKHDHEACIYTSLGRLIEAVRASNPLKDCRSI